MLATNSVSDTGNEALHQFGVVSTQQQKNGKRMPESTYVARALVNFIYLDVPWSGD